MSFWWTFCLFFALSAQQRTASGYVYPPVTVLRLGPLDPGLKTEVEEGQPEYQEGSQQKDDFLPGSAPPGHVYEMAEQTRGKRCADDFDCMRVLGQVCKKNKRGSAGTCQCPPSTPVRIAEHGQLRCVSARLIFEDCTDTAECSYLNPYVECINEVCTCGPPNILKRKDLCIPATTSTVLPNLILSLSVTLMSIGALLGITAFAKRVFAGKEGARYGVYPRCGRRLKEERPRVLVDGMKRFYSRCVRKMKEVVSRQGQKTNAVSLSSDNVAREQPVGPLHEITVQAEVHVPYEPTESTEALIPPSDRGPERVMSNETLTATVNSAGASSSTRSPRRPRGENAFESNTPPAEDVAKELQGVVGDNETELSKDLDSIVRLVLRGVSVVDKMDGKEEKPPSLETEEGTAYEHLASDAAKLSYSHSLVRLRAKLQAKAAPEASSVDEVSYGDACRVPGSVEDKVVEIDDGSPLDKGAGEAKSKTYADVSTLCHILTPQMHGSLFSATKTRQGRFRQSDTVSEHQCGGGLHDLPLFGQSNLESYRRLPGTIDTYPLVQKPRRTYLLKEEQCAIISDSLHSCSDTSYSRMIRQRQRGYNFLPPTVVCDKRDVIRSAAQFYKRTRDSLNEFLAGNSTSMPPCATSSGCFSTGVSEFPERMGAAPNREGTRGKERYSEFSSRGSKEERLRSILEEVPPIPVDDDCSDEGAPLMRTQKGSELPPAVVVSVHPADTNPNLGSTGQSRRADPECVMPERSVSVVTNRPLSAIHSWGSTSKAENLLSTTNVELCSSGPSGELVIGSPRTTQKLRKEPEPAYVDPTSSSPSSGGQIPTLFLIAASRGHTLELRAADAGSEECLRELPSTQAQQQSCKNRLAVVKDDVNGDVEREVNEDNSLPKAKKFPATSSVKQEHLPGSSLIKDKLLNEDVVLLTDSSKEYDSDEGSRPGSATQVAVNKPLSSLRRGDLKGIIKELLEEEYAHVLQFSAQQIYGTDTVQRVEAPDVSCGSHRRPATTSQKQEKESEPSSRCPEYRGSPIKGPSEVTEQTRGKKDVSTKAAAVLSETEIDEQQRTLQGATVTSSQTCTALGDPRVRRASTSSSGRLYTELSFPEIDATSDSDITSPYEGPYGDAGADASRTCPSETTTATSSSSTSRVEYSSIEGGHLHSEIKDEEQEAAQLLSAVTVYTSSGSKPVQPPQIAHNEVPPLIHVDVRSPPGAAGYLIPPATDITDPSAEKLFTSSLNGGRFTPRYDPTIPQNPMPSVDVPSFMNTSAVMSSDRTSLFYGEVPETQMILQREQYIADRCKNDVANTGFLGDVSELPFSSVHASEIDSNTGTDGTPAPSPAVRTRPKSASFPCMPGRRESDAGKQHTAVPRTKSYTDYWLKTVSLFKEVTSSQLSYSTESDRIMGTESMSQLFYDTEPQTRRSTQPEEISSPGLFLHEGNEMNPLLRTFLYLQESVHTPTATQNTTRSYESHDVKGTLTQVRSKLSPFTQRVKELPDDLNELAVVDSKTNSDKSFSLHSSADYYNVAEGGPEKRRVLSESTVPVYGGVTSSQTEPSNVLDDRIPIFSTNATTLNNPASFEDSSSDGSRDRKPLKKVFRKTAPYRTPFPLCSSSRSSPAVRQHFGGFKRSWEARRCGSPSEYTTPSGSQGPFSAHRTRSLTEPEQVVVEGLPKKSASASSYLGNSRLWKQDSLPFQHWLSTVTRESLRPVEGDGISLHEPSRHAVSLDESAEYHDPMHSSMSSNRQSELREDSGRFFTDFPDDDNP